ncbi:hypothetical protein EDF24_3751 [Curtobacterium sp. PhB130]|uniref:hypothetical protein n=1 Tax=unclassified Curtobacterium TaxID=257496 RepID=UPI000F4B6E06|nr:MULTISPECIES: hypothetical protein [unclassified Curtobacterium]ROS71892.1 hypothetical protein EDF24_3751 [Curtobacterium sp. PhB130]TCK58283.1 hypothetical protein EDF27_3895 [Curtobacterium sp. PhB136]
MNRIRTAVLRRTVTLQADLQERLDKLTEDAEAGLEDSAWKAIWVVSGAVAAIAIAGTIVAWVNGYLGKLPG